MATQNVSQTIIKEVLLDASPSRVWEVITNKDELKQWCFDIQLFEVKEGFEFQFYGEKDGIQFLHLCKVLEVEKERKMKWLWTYENVAGKTYVTFELFPEGNQTMLRLSHEGLETLPQDENYARQNFVEGWNMIIGKLLPEYLTNRK